MHTIHFTVGFSSFVDAASSRQIAVVTLMLTVRDLQNLIFKFKFHLDHKNNEKILVLMITFLWVVAKQHD